MTSSEQYLVFDIGGTSLRGANYDPATKRIDQCIVVDTPTCSFADNSASALSLVIKAMEQIALRLDAQPRLVCIGFAGPVDSDGQLHAAPTIWGEQSQPVPLKAFVQKAWPDAIVEVVNDVTAAGYYFVSKTTRDFMVVTVGSGVGGKLFLNGEPVLGPNSRGGEIGHWRVTTGPDALPCDCGARGHLGGSASGRGILRAIVQAARQHPTAFGRSTLSGKCGGALDRLTNEMVVSSFLANDEWACGVVDKCTAGLGQALAAIHLTTGIESFKIVGGFASALGNDYRRILADSASAAMWDNGFRWLEAIEVSKPEDQPGLNGAGRMLQERYG